MTRRRKSRDDDRDLTVAEAAGVNNDDTVLDHLRRVRPEIYGPPTAAMLRRDLAYLTRRR